MLSQKKNEDRAEEAQRTLDFFASTFNSDEDAIVDLLANLMHWCKQEGRDFDKHLHSAQINFEAEQPGEVPPDAKLIYHMAVGLRRAVRQRANSKSMASIQTELGVQIDQHLNLKESWLFSLGALPADISELREKLKLATDSNELRRLIEAAVPIAMNAMTHELKTDPEVWDDVKVGYKTFEIRLDDREYRVGDVLNLRRTQYTGREMKGEGKPLIYGESQWVTVKYILHGPAYGLAEHWVIMSIE